MQTQIVNPSDVKWPFLATRELGLAGKFALKIHELAEKSTCTKAMVYAALFFLVLVTLPLLVLVPFYLSVHTEWVKQGEERKTVAFYKECRVAFEKLKQCKEKPAEVQIGLDEMLEALRREIEDSKSKAQEPNLSKTEQDIEKAQNAFEKQKNRRSVNLDQASLKLKDKSKVVINLDALIRDIEGAKIETKL